MSENVLKSILLEGTRLVQEIASNRVSMESFLKRYDNFYYYNALDGHEADSQETSLLKKYSTVISLHKDIQTTVVDVVYLGDKASSSEYFRSGRISIEDAMIRIIEISKKYKLDKLLSKFEN